MTKKPTCRKSRKSRKKSRKSKKIRGGTNPNNIDVENINIIRDLTDDDVGVLHEPVNLDLTDIPRESFMKLLLINAFYEIYSNIYDVEETLSNGFTTPVGKSTTNIGELNTVPRHQSIGKRLKMGGGKMKTKRKTKGGSIDDNTYIMLLAYLDNIHDFNNNSRCKVKYENNENMKSRIKSIYNDIHLTDDHMNICNLTNEGLILHKFMSMTEFESKLNNIIFKMNTKFIIPQSTATSLKRTIKHVDNNNAPKYIIQGINIPKNKCILYDSPIPKLKLEQNNYISTVITVKRNPELYNSSPEKLFDSGTSYTKGMCDNIIKTSIDYNAYPLLKFNKDIPNVPVIFEKTHDNNNNSYLTLYNSLSNNPPQLVYSQKTGFSLRQLKEWVIEKDSNFGHSTISNKLNNQDFLPKISSLVNYITDIIKTDPNNHINVSLTNDNDLKTFIALSIKRLGDWSMVERCKLNNNVFITNDTLCALYGLLSNINMWFHVPSTYSEKLIEDHILTTTETNMGLVCHYKREVTSTNINADFNKKLEIFINNETEYIKNIINQSKDKFKRYLIDCKYICDQLDIISPI
jgi:hypothetical protein